jgi:hypothetical protein
LFFWFAIDYDIVMEFDMEWAWKKKIFVFDDIVPAKTQEQIQQWILSETFPWHFMPDVTGGGARDARPAMKHFFISQGKKLSTQQLDFPSLILTNALEQLYSYTKERADYELVNCRSFLQFPLNNLAGAEYDAHHIDISQEHLSILYYVIDADGDTVLFENFYSEEESLPPEPLALIEKQRVSPKRGRVVVFDGYHWHTATQPRTGLRCVINSNVIARPEIS